MKSKGNKSPSLELVLACPQAPRRMLNHSLCAPACRNCSSNDSGVPWNTPLVFSNEYRVDRYTFELSNHSDTVIGPDLTIWGEHDFDMNSAWLPDNQPRCSKALHGLRRMSRGT